MITSAIQLYTLRDVDESIEATLERIAETNYEGVEFAGLGSQSPSAIASALEENELAVVGAHVGIDQLESAYDEVVDTYRKIGCSRFIVPSYDSDAFTTRGGVDAVAARLSELAERLDDDGFELGYHNHAFEFEDLGGETAFDRFVAQSSDLVALEIDTGLTKHAGQDPVELIRRYGNRTSLIHLTDTHSGSDSTMHVDLGVGEVDLEGCLDAARDAGIEWIVYEHGQTTDPVASLARSDSALSALLSD